MQVWIRDPSDTNGHPYREENGLLIANYFHKGTFHGFSFNPGLRRTRDYLSIGSYSKHTSFDRRNPAKSEIEIGKIYHKKGMKAAILPEGYVRHTGQNRHVT